MYDVPNASGLRRRGASGRGQGASRLGDLLAPWPSRPLTRRLDAQEPGKRRAGRRPKKKPREAPGNFLAVLVCGPKIW
jgi:hypothetical protein